MAIIGSWNGFDFEISPSVVRGFSGLTIKGSVETEDKVTSKQKYATMKNSAATEIGLNVVLNAYLGCDVREEAMNLVRAATAGAANYFYTGGKKLLDYKLMLISAEITEADIAPNGTWISAKVALKMKQAEKYTAPSSGSSAAAGGSQTGAQSSGFGSALGTGLGSVLGALAGAAAQVVQQAGATLAQNAAAQIIGENGSGANSDGSQSTLASEAAALLANTFAAVRQTAQSALAATQSQRNTGAVSTASPLLGGLNAQIHAALK